MKSSIIGFLLAFAVLLQMQAANAEDNNTCKNAWQSSPAYQSCSKGDTMPVGNAGVIQVVRLNAEGACWITASCRMANGGDFITSFNGPAAEVKTINNCNGTLKASSC